MTSLNSNKMKYLAVVLMSVSMLLMTGCQGSPDGPPYEILSNKLHTRLDEQGIKLFAYVVSVKASGGGTFKPGETMSRSEARRMLREERFEDSRVLKLQLEEQAVEMLKHALKTEHYCPASYRIDEVLWRDLSVQLRGRCL